MRGVYVSVKSLAYRRRMRRHDDETSEAGSATDNPTVWLLIFSDLTTLLLTFFVLRLALVVPELKAPSTKGLTGAADSRNAAITGAEVNSTSFAPRLFTDSVEQKFQKLGFDLSAQAIAGILVLMSQELFQEGSAELSFESTAKIAQFSSELRQAVAAHGMRIERIEVRGHSDRRAVNSARFPTNWELSMARAKAVSRQLIDSGVSEQMITVAGYGDSRPISRNQKPVTLHLNRRTELLIKLSGNVRKQRVSENPHLAVGRVFS